MTKIGYFAILGEFCKTKVDPITPKHISYSLSTQILFWETFKVSCFWSSIGTFTVDLVITNDNEYWFQVKFEDRKQCAACRYVECQRIGMRPSLVLSEDEKHDRFKNLKRKTDQTQSHQEKRNLVCSPQIRCLISYL